MAQMPMRYDQHHAHDSKAVTDIQEPELIYSKFFRYYKLTMKSQGHDDCNL